MFFKVSFGLDQDCFFFFVFWTKIKTLQCKTDLASKCSKLGNLTAQTISV